VAAISEGGLRVYFKPFCRSRNRPACHSTLQCAEYSPKVQLPSSTDLPIGPLYIDLSVILEVKRTVVPSRISASRVMIQKMRGLPAVPARDNEGRPLSMGAGGLASFWGYLAAVSMGPGTVPILRHARDGRDKEEGLPVTDLLALKRAN